MSAKKKTDDVIIEDGTDDVIETPVEEAPVEEPKPAKKAKAAKPEGNSVMMENPRGRVVAVPAGDVERLTAEGFTKA